MSVMKTISAPFRLAKWCVVGEKLECVESAKRIGKLLKAEKRVLQQKNFEEVTAGWTLNDFERGRSKFCVRLIFKFPARYLNVLQNKSLTEINKGSNCGLAWSIYLRRLICLRKVASTSYFH